MYFKINNTTTSYVRSTLSNFDGVVDFPHLVYMAWRNYMNL